MAEQSSLEDSPEERLAEPDAGAAPQQDGEPPFPPIRYSWYVVAVLMLVYIFSFIDRQILSMLVGPIKADLDISDTQMSYLMGFMFALFYTVFGIPIGRLADSKSRRGIIAIGLFIWSLMTTGCGLARTYWQLALMRMGVGVGEATLSPSAYSLISDSFPKEKLGTAISVYSMGIYIGSGMATLLGGFVVEFAGGDDVSIPLFGTIRPWQVVFFYIGIPGILIVPLLTTVKEPFRRGVKMVKSAAGGNVAQQIPLGQVMGYMRRNAKTIICHNVGFALLSFSSYGAGAWIPTFFVRTHEMTAADAGKIYGVIVMICGTSGIVFGGRLADKLTKRGVRDAKILVGCMAAFIWMPTGFLYPMVSNHILAFALLVPTVFFAAMPFGVAPAAIQEMMPNRMRGQAAAIYLFVVNLIGLGIGPSAVAWMTDLFYEDPMKLRYSLLWVAVVAHTVAGLLLFVGRKPFVRSMDHLEDWNKANG